MENNVCLDWLLGSNWVNLSKVFTQSQTVSSKKLRKILLYEKPAHKMLVKLTLGVVTL